MPIAVLAGPPEVDDDPSAVALEQYLYWRELGLSHDAMLEAIGIVPRWQDQLSSDQTIDALAAAYRRLQQRGAA
jgi:hypothetical protein